MRVVVAPDSFTGSLTAAQAAAAISAGWSRTWPADTVIARPLSDGGPGFLDAIEAGLGGQRTRRLVCGPLREPVEADLLLTPGEPATAWVESATAAGLSLIPLGSRNPQLTTTEGVGELIRIAVGLGARRIVVGVGGTGTCDAGAGLLGALGARWRGPAEAALGAGGLALHSVDWVDLEPCRAALAEVQLQVATDVDVPLLGSRGAALGFAAQKGASPQQAEALEAALGHFAEVVGPDKGGLHPAVALGAGAGGGLGFALLALGAQRVAGIETVISAVNLAEAVAGADLVITGEGAFDWQSAAGKVVAGVGAVAGRAAVPTIVLAGRVELARSQWPHLGISAAFGLVPADQPRPVGHSYDSAWDDLADLAARVAVTWGRR